MQYLCSSGFDIDSSRKPEDPENSVLFSGPASCHVQVSKSSVDGSLMCFVFHKSHLILFIPVSRVHGWIYRWPNCEACLSKKKEKEKDIVGFGGRGWEVMTQPRGFFWHCPRLCHKAGTYGGFDVFFSNEVKSIGTMSHFSSWVSLSWLPWY